MSWIIDIPAVPPAQAMVAPAVHLALVNRDIAEQCQQKALKFIKIAIGATLAFGAFTLFLSTIRHPVVSKMMGVDEFVTKALVMTGAVGFGICAFVPLLKSIAFVLASHYCDVASTALEIQTVESIQDQIDNLPDATRQLLLSRSLANHCCSQRRASRLNTRL